MAILVSLLTRGSVLTRPHSQTIPVHFTRPNLPKQNCAIVSKAFTNPASIIHNPSHSQTLVPVPSQFGGGRVRLADSHALFLVDVETVILNAEIVLQVGLGADEFLQGGLGGAQAVL